jgi:hypothetical protein
MSAPDHQVQNSAIDRQLQMLGELAELGLEQARALDRKIKQTEPEPSLDELQAAALAYTRVSRAVRMAILLQSELMGRQAGQADERRKAQGQARAEHAGRAVDVIRRVTRAALPNDPFAVSSIAREAAERLETDAIYGDVMNLPVGEIVDLICTDLGLSPDWAALGREAWAEAEARSGAQGSPFVDGGVEREPIAPLYWRGEDPDKVFGPPVGRPDSS